MGTSAVAILFSDISRERVAAAIKEAFPTIAADVQFDFRENGHGYGYIVFPEPGKISPGDASHRKLLFMPGEICSDYEAIYNGPRTILNLNVWGSSTEILTAILERFGGYLLPNDGENSSDPESWYFIGPPENAFSASDPKDRLRIALAKMVGHDLSTKLTSLADQPGMLSAVMAQFDAYLFDKEIVDSLQLLTTEPEMEFSGVGAKVAWKFSAGPDTHVGLHWSLPDDVFQGYLEASQGRSQSIWKAQPWLIEHLKKSVSDDPEQTFSDLKQVFVDEFPKYRFDDATVARARELVAKWAANETSENDGPKL
jgi:hypothetical protein